MNILIDPETDAWALANLPYFRGLGFFSDLTERSDAEVLFEIHRRHVEAEGFPYTRLGKSPPPWKIELPPPLADLFLLEYDSSRVWCDDMECVAPGESAYVSAITRWGAISRGAFAPSRIEESWDDVEDESESLVVRVRLSAETLTLEPDVCDDWFDLSILPSINECIVDSDVRLELYKPFDQTAFVVALTPDEKEELCTTRDWAFHEFFE